MKYFTLTRGIKLLLSILFVCLFSCEDEEVEVKPFYEDRISISEYIKSKGDTFQYFFQLLEVGGMERTLTAYNPGGNDYTLFLPTNEAIDQFIDDNNQYQSFAELLADTIYVRELVRYHVVNSAIEKNDFPFGVLSDTTISGDLLIMGFSGDIDSLVYKVNNHASIINTNIIVTNGLIHVIDNVLIPVVYTSFEWLQQQEGYSIFTRALEITALKDTFKVNNRHMSNTLLVESDEVFNNDNIHSIDDLILRISPNHDDYTSSSNDLYQFMAYHILNGKHFLNDFEGTNTNYNTYASSTISVNGKGLDIKINQGIGEFIHGSDTIDYIQIDYDNSNITTTNGAIHFIQDVMEFYLPGQIQRTFQFFEEPLIIEANNNADEYSFNRPEDFDNLQWEGIEEIIYVKSSSANGANNNDYIEFDGDFTLTYNIPEILPGAYLIQIRARTGSSENATIQVFVDDNDQIGTNIDLTSGNGFQLFEVGLINFVRYEKHQIRIENLTPGVFAWDFIRFQPK